VSVMQLLPMIDYTLHITTHARLYQVGVHANSSQTFDLTRYIYSKRGNPVLNLHQKLSLGVQ
jgi:hypothetical protein